MTTHGRPPFPSAAPPGLHAAFGWAVGLPGEAPPGFDKPGDDRAGYKAHRFSATTAMQATTRLAPTPAALRASADAMSIDLDRLQLAMGEDLALEAIGAMFGAFGRDLAHPLWMAHMDPPPLRIAALGHLWASSLNQNLLHDDTAPFARRLERWVLERLSPTWHMGQGLVVPGSTVANLTALWAARDTAGVDTVITSAASHHSIAKAARILGLRLLQIPTDTRGRWDESVAAETVARAGERAAVVPTMGTTTMGAIDSLEWLSDVSGPVGWVHVDAAWAGPLGFTSFAHRLGTAFAEGLVDSVAVSAHKWMFQPKDSALAMFKPDLDLEPISATAGYLSTANLGIQGSRGADAVLALALTLAAYGVEELGTWIEWCLGLADRLTTAIAPADRFEVHEGSDAGVVVWRPTARPGHETMAAAIERAGVGVSLTRLDEDWWFRSVSANPFAEPEEIVERLTGALA